MNNKDIVAKIKAEIERRVDILATVSVKQAKDGDSEMSTYYHGKAVSLEELISFLSTLEPEKPMNQEGLKEEINRTYHDGSVADTSDMDHVTYENIAEYFYELGCRRTAEKYDEIEYNRQRAEESVPKDLEEAAEKHLDTMFGKGKHQPFYKELFIAGAEWQAEHAPLPEDTVLFNKGVEEGKRLAEEEQADLFTIVALDAAQRAKEQMMKEAVEYEVGMHGEPIKITFDKYVQRARGIFPGDKVRIIIVKED